MILKKGFFIRWISNSLALIIVASFLEGIVIKDIYSALIASLILGVVNAVIKPIIYLFTLPITVFTMGFSILIVNGAMLYLTSRLVEGFEVHGFWSAIFGSILISIFSGFFNYIIGDQGNIQVMHFDGTTNYHTHHHTDTPHYNNNEKDAIEVEYKIIDDEKK
ncbi:phage holin family protein [Candidatus Poribacteria bacterium]|nr:phage holin family protein [Candidatus Poribacteria bacterium]